MLKKSLQSFGLNDKEVGVYLACLELGKAKVSEIGHKSRVERTHCYSILDKLVSLGLVNEVEHGARKHFVAEAPEKIEMVLKERLEQIKHILPELKSIYNVSAHKPKVRFYEGQEQVKLVHQEILDSGVSEILLCGSLDDLQRIISKEWDDGYFIPTRIERKMFIRFLSFDTPSNRKYRALDKQSLRETRFLDKQFYFDSVFYLYGEKVAVFSGPGETIGLVIESRALAKMFTQFFEIMWASAK